MLKQTAGISFSAAGQLVASFTSATLSIFASIGVSTCLWRGVHVRDILLKSDLQDQPETERWYLNFEGLFELRLI